MTGSRLPSRLRSLLVIAEVALALCVVICAGLSLRSYLTLTHESLGFDPDNLYAAMDFWLPSGRSGAAVSALQSLPGTSVAAADDAPFMGRNQTDFTFPGNPRFQSGMIEFDGVSPTFFDVMHIPLIRGRPFREMDGASSMQVAIVNAAFARRYFENASPIGRHIIPQTWSGATTSPPVRTIVGEVGDVRNAYALTPEPQIYAPINQLGDATIFIVRTNRPDPEATNAIYHALARIAPLEPSPAVAPFDEFLQSNARQANAGALLFGLLALLSLLLALAGIYAAAHYSSQQRTHEFGIRKALGAANRGVLLDVLSGALFRAAIGIAIGLIGSALIARGFSSMLYRTSPLDRPTLFLAALLLAAMSVFAALFPALRAARVDPADSLRYE